MTPNEDRPAPGWAREMAHRHLWPDGAFPMNAEIHIERFARLLASVRDVSIRGAARECASYATRRTSDIDVYGDSGLAFTARDMARGGKACENLVLALLHSPPVCPSCGGQIDNWTQLGRSSVVVCMDEFHRRPWPTSSQEKPL